MQDATSTTWPDTERVHIELGANRIAYRRFGSGPVLLLVHGFPLSGCTWRKLLPALEQHFDCVVPDLPGLGETAWSEATDFSWAGQARTLAALCDALGIGRCAVLAHDTGGSIARCLALAEPARIERLAIINSEIPHHRPPWIPLYQALIALPGSLPVFRLLLRSRMFLRSPLGFGGCFVDRELIRGEFEQRFIAPLLASPRRLLGMARYLRGLSQWQVIDRFATDHARLAMPVRLIWGARDPTFPLPLARAMLTQFPDADLVEIADAKLLPHEERPAETLRAVLDFLQDTGAPVNETTVARV
jgi:haloalkane dehalogenase